MIDEKKLIEDLRKWAMDNFSSRDDRFEYVLAGVEKALEIIEAQPQVGGWIPVTERLPEEGYGVLVTVNGKHNNITFIDALEIAEYDSTDGWIVEGYLDWIDPDVTAWQPLPEPFEGSDKK